MDVVTNSIQIKTNSKLDISPEGDFFRVWVEFLKPIHGLTNREMDVLASFLKKRYELSKEIISEERLDKVLMSQEVKKQIWESCGINNKHFQMVMSKLRRNGVIKDNKIYSKLIPYITKDGVGLMIYFDFDKREHIRLGNQT